MFARTVHFLRHWFTPHHSNNFRAKILHNTGWLALIGVFLTFNIFVRSLDSTSLHVLGFTSSITIDEVVRQTNEQRVALGLKPLKYNETLADAARRKAANMFAENYWAHVSPKGENPWTWFSAAGYKYTHAGENLAKDFGSTDRMVSAWMASPTHRANIVNDTFQDIGVAVVPGTLLGSDTVLVVQLFGTTAGAGTVAAPAKVAQVEGVATTPAPKQTAVTAKPTVTPVVATPEPAPVNELKTLETPAPLGKNPAMNEFDLRRLAGLVTTALLILVLLADAFFAESRQLSRRVGKNWAHILYINVILILVTIINAGRIL